MAKQSEWDTQNRSAKGERSNGDGEPKTDAIEMLKADHRRVEQLFDKYDQARRRAEKSKLAQQICLELTIHAELEEEIFYPACREHVDDPLLDEAQIEHDTAKILVAEVAMGTPTADPFFDAKVKVLAEYMRHHIQEEEKGADSIFNEARKGGVDTAALGARMASRREELMDQFSEELMLPQPKALHVTLAQDEEVWASPPASRRGAHAGEGRRGEERASWESGSESEGEEGRGWGEREDEAGGAYDERRSAHGRQDSEHGWHGEAGRRAQAARRGWEEREIGGGPSRGREEERGESRKEEGRGSMARGQERGASRSGQERGGQERGSEHRGWRGDPKGHSEASRRGWEHRR
ncbi:hemerythrin domain-containing protein [Methylocystis sp. IM3]|uniref:hemerythrin domain-containing protein n=1 Tax=unclassified Methylocystis TaxID=2625913 RepID=UPI0030F71066